jgi:hypothetical protein
VAYEDRWLEYDYDIDHITPGPVLDNPDISGVSAEVLREAKKDLGWSSSWLRAAIALQGGTAW